MPEVYMKFTLPDEKDELTLAENGMKFWSVIFEFDQFMRNCLKYEHKFESADDAIEKLRNYLHGLMDENHISIDMVN